MDKKIQILICNYLDLASQVASELRKVFGVQSLLKSVNAGEFPRKGRTHILGGGEYFFHGIGCRFVGSELELDFDFGPNETLIGADPWKLYNFAVDHGEAYPWLPERKVFQMEIENLISKGILRYCAIEPSEHLVCLTSPPTDI